MNKNAAFRIKISNEFTDTCLFSTFETPVDGSPEEEFASELSRTNGGFVAETASALPLPLLLDSACAFPLCSRICALFRGGRSFCTAVTRKIFRLEWFSSFLFDIHCTFSGMLWKTHFLN